MPPPSTYSLADAYDITIFMDSTRSPILIYIIATMFISIKEKVFNEFGDTEGVDSCGCDDCTRLEKLSATDSYDKESQILEDEAIEEYVRYRDLAV